MTWRKPDEMLVRLLDETIAGLDTDQPVDFKPMFGCPAYFIRGNMFAGVWQDSLMLRLPDGQRQQVRDAGGWPFEPMEGRPMKEYVVLPPADVADHGALQDWVLRAAGYAASLPPKAPKRRKPRG